MLTRLNKKQGYTLIEIIIVIGISLCILAMSIFLFLRWRINANDIAAVGSVEAIAAALEAYEMSKGEYTGSLNTLASANPPYLSDGFSDGLHQGYRFSIYSYTSGKKDYAILARPEIYGVTGSKYIAYIQGNTVVSFDSLASANSYLGIGGGGGGSMPCRTEI